MVGAAARQPPAFEESGKHPETQGSADWQGETVAEQLGGALLDYAWTLSVPYWLLAGCEALHTAH